MTVDIKSEDARTIRQLIPLSTLPSKIFARLCRKITIESTENGQYLFKRGDLDSDLYYLLEGSINLQTESFNIQSIKAGSDSARFAIAHQIPRKVDAISDGRIQFLRLNIDMIKKIQETSYKDNQSTMMVEELEDNDDWVTTLLKSPIFRALPPANLQKILMSLQEIRFNAGEIIIRQDEPGDYYYIVKKGLAFISRKPSPTAKEIKLAQIRDLDTFGEDAIISGMPRTVSITAMTDMSLLRLDKEQFIELIKQPTLKYIEYEKLHELLSANATLVDVRSPDEFKKSHLARSINVPFFSLRMYLKTLNKHHPIILACKDGRISESSAFILLQHKFNALVLRGGMSHLAPDQLKAEPALFNIDDGMETRTISKKIDENTTLEFETVSQTRGNAADFSPALQELKAKCKRLELDKMALELKYSSLARQLEAAKLELDKLKRS